MIDLVVESPAGGTFVLRGAPDAVRTVYEFAHPYLREAARDGRGVPERGLPRQGPATDWTIVLGNSPPAGLPFATDGPEPPHQVVLRPERRQVDVSCADQSWLPLLAVRYIRTLARAVAVAQGAIPLHGAAVRVHGMGLLLVGRKWAGKTTAALSLARAEGGGVVSNDDVLLLDRPTGWGMVGGPRSVGIRTDSLAQHVPALTPADLAAAAVRHPATREDKVFLLAAEIAALGGTAVVDAPADVIVELRAAPTGPEQVERLADAEAAALLAEHLEQDADRRRLDLLAAVGRPRPTLDRAVVGSLVSSLSFYRYTHAIGSWVPAFLEFVRSLSPVRSQT